MFTAALRTQLPPVHCRVRSIPILMTGPASGVLVRSTRVLPAITDAVPLSFEGSWPEPDPQTPLVVYLTPWVEMLRASGTQSVRTTLAYTSDLSQIAEELCLQLRKQPAYEVFPPNRCRVREEDIGPDTKAELARWPELSEGPWTVLKARLAVLTLLDLHPRNIAAVLRWAAAEKSPATARRYRASIASFCRYLVREHVLASNPADDPIVVIPKQPSQEILPLTLDETTRLLAICSEPDDSQRDPWPELDLAVIVVGLTTGMRVDELVTQRMNKLDLTGDSPYASVRGKGGKVRSIPLVPEAVDVLLPYLADRQARYGPMKPDDLLFVRPGGAPLDTRTLRHRVDRLLVRAGIVRRWQACVHVLRHTFATGVLNSGATIEELRELLGHQTIATTARYVKAMAEGTREAVKSQQVRGVIKAAPRPFRASEGR